MTEGFSRGGARFAYVLMRIVVGAAFAQHGAQKLFGYFGGMDAGRGFWPIENDGELAVLFCFVFLYIAFRGGGPSGLGGSGR